MSHPSDHSIKRYEETRDGCVPCELKALVRPRYFCGQLLTEEDLDAGQRYHREKMRLHNRHLHGWGVVCGLEVLCHPRCSEKGYVLVKPGHAIECCGNDIVVDRPFDLNILNMIDKRPAPLDDCLGPKKHEPCNDLEKTYCLVIRYAEEPLRPQTALKKEDEGCTVKRCEPSRTKETYRFELTDCKECSGLRRLNIPGLIYNPTLFIDSAISNIATTYDDYDDVFKRFCKLKERALSVGKELNCNLGNELYEIEFPPNKKGWRSEAVELFRELQRIIARVKAEWNCLQRLPKCPECKDDDVVVLACVTVKGDMVTHINNASRRLVQTFTEASDGLKGCMFIDMDVDEAKDIFEESGVTVLEVLPYSPMFRTDTEVLTGLDEWIRSRTEYIDPLIRYRPEDEPVGPGWPLPKELLIRPGSNVVLGISDDGKVMDVRLVEMGYPTLVREVSILKGELDHIRLEKKVEDTIRSVAVAEPWLAMRLAMAVAEETPVEEVVKKADTETLKLFELAGIRTLGDLMLADPVKAGVHAKAGREALIKAAKGFNGELKKGKISSEDAFVKKFDSKAGKKALAKKTGLDGNTIERLVKRIGGIK